MSFSFQGAEYSFRYPEFFSLLYFFVPGALIVGFLLALREVQARRGRIGGLFRVFLRWCLVMPLVFAGMVFLLLGLQRIVGEFLEYPIGGKIVFLIDGSPSMGAKDVPEGVFGERIIVPSRLALCTESLVTAFKGVRGPEVMLLVFTEATTFRTGKWFRLGPDTEAQFAGMLRSLRRAPIGAGTNPMRALSEATAELGTDPDMMIFCSDGETEYEPTQIVDWARTLARGKKKYIPIYTLGAGTPHRPSSIPLIGVDGKTEAGEVRSPTDKSIVFTEFNGVLLESIAREGGGEYRHLKRITDARDLLRSALLRAFRGGNKQGVRVESAEDLTAPILVATLVLVLFLVKGLSWLRALGRVLRGS